MNLFIDRCISAFDPSFLNLIKIIVIKQIKVLAVASGLLLVSQASYAAVDMFLDIEGVDGESQDAGHSMEIDILAWSWGTTTVGKKNAVCAQHVSFTKYVDIASAPLLMGQALGMIYPTATLTVRTAGDSPVEYMVLTFTNIRVTSLSTGGSGGEDRLTENVSFSFDEVNFTYTSPNDTGATGAQQTATVVNSGNCN